MSGHDERLIRAQSNLLCTLDRVNNFRFLSMQAPIIRLSQQHSKRVFNQLSRTGLYRGSGTIHSGIQHITSLRLKSISTTLEIHAGPAQGHFGPPGTTISFAEVAKSRTDVTSSWTMIKNKCNNNINITVVAVLLQTFCIILINF